MGKTKEGLGPPRIDERPVGSTSGTREEEEVNRWRSTAGRESTQQPLQRFPVVSLILPPREARHVPRPSQT